MRRYTRLLKLSFEIVFYLLTIRWHELHKPMEEWRFVRAGVADHFAELENGTVHYWLGGKPDKPPLLLIPTINHDGKGTYCRSIVPFSREYRVVVPDLVWYGQSTSDKEEYTLDFQAHTLVQLMDHLGIRDFSVLGACYGGTIAYRMAELITERLDKLIVANDPVVGWTLEDMDEVARRTGVEDTNRLGYPETPEEFRLSIQLAFHKPPPLPDYFIRRAYKKHFSHYETQRRELVRSMTDYRIESAKNPPRPEDLPQKKMLLLWGRQDRIYGAHAGERAARILGERAELRFIENAGDALHIDQPKVFNRLVLEYLQRKDGGINGQETPVAGRQKPT